jgi:hypothetical protein
MKPNTTDRTIRIIERGGRILVKANKGNWYLSAYSNIAAGPDHAVWSVKNEAMPFFNLHLAHTIAKFYDAKVVVSYPKKKVEDQESTEYQKMLANPKMDPMPETFTITRQEAEVLQYLLVFGVGGDVTEALDLDRLMMRLPVANLDHVPLMGRINLALPRSANKPLTRTKMDVRNNLQCPCVDRQCGVNAPDVNISLTPREEIGLNHIISGAIGGDVLRALHLYDLQKRLSERHWNNRPDVQFTHVVNVLSKEPSVFTPHCGRSY